MENTATSTPAPAPRLYRSATEKIVGGVCGGLAAYFKIDPVVVRLAFVVFALAGGASVLLYILLWIAVPVGDGAATSLVSRPVNNEVIAVVLIGVGAVWLLANTGVFRLVNWSFAWPLAVVALGIALLVRRS